MRKILFLLMALPLLLVSCDDDNDFPTVNLGVETSGCKVVDGTIYVVKGDTLSIDSLSVKAVNGSTKVAIAGVNYFWDRMYVAMTNIPPFQFSLDTGNAMVGRHLLQIRSSLLAIDYAPVIAVITYPVVVVNDDSDIPSGKVETSLFVKPKIDD